MVPERGRATEDTATTVTTRAGTERSTTREREGLEVKAMVTPPTIIRGARMRMRKAIMMNIWTWLMSLVVRVMRVAVPKDSNSVRERAAVLRNTAPRRSRPKPMETWELKIPLLTAQSTPKRAKSSISAPVRRMSR